MRTTRERGSFCAHWSNSFLTAEDRAGAFKLGWARSSLGPYRINCILSSTSASKSPLSTRLPSWLGNWVLKVPP